MIQREIPMVVTGNERSCWNSPVFLRLSDDTLEVLPSSSYPRMSDRQSQLVNFLQRGGLEIELRHIRESSRGLCQTVGE